jgi:sulfite reductase (ferredoxin)
MKNNLAESWVMQVPADLSVGLDSLENSVGEFKAGAISDGEFRIIRVPQGIYEQRESGTYMLRVRCPAGGVTPSHLRRLGEVAAKWGNGLLHVTTRQEFQVHRVPIASILPALRSLAEAGLSTLGGGGNTLRNVTACFDSGVCRDEVFDVAPYAIATTERLLADPISLQLPRKYKIAFAACDRDCSGATVHDAGFIARRKDGVEGFAVYVAGGMGGKSRVSSLLHEFIPASKAVSVAEAIKRVFDKNGDRKNKHLARLRFLIEKIGIEAFRELYNAELAEVHAAHPAPVVVRHFPGREPLPDAAAQTVPKGHPAFARWFQNNVAPQKQPGFFLVHIPLELGDLPSAKTAALADLVAAHGDGILYATQSQNISLRWIAGSELTALFEKLDTLGLAEPQPPVLRNLVACAGASTCRLGICLSRGLANAARRKLTGSEQDLEALGDLSIHISGCPNSCGRHPIGNIGFSGAARRVDGAMVPYYAVQVGGRLGAGTTRFGASVGAVPARNAPAFIGDFLAAWRASDDAADFHQFIDHNGKEIAKELIERHQREPLFKQDGKFFFDWDANSAFSLAGRGAGECSAGVFDLIEVDLANARESLEAGRFYAAAFSAAHSLLVTRGLQPKLERDTFDLFLKYFVGENLVDSALAAVVAEGARSAAEPNPAEAFADTPAAVTTLVANVRQLYESMDSSLRFKPAAK